MGPASGARRLPASADTAPPTAGNPRAVECGLRMARERGPRSIGPPITTEEQRMSIRAAINGLGRTGRAALRAAAERDAPIEWVAVNDLMGIEMLAQLLRRDSVYGRFPGEVSVDGDVLRVGHQEIRVFSEADPAELPWGELGVDVAIEST